MATLPWKDPGKNLLLGDPRVDDLEKKKSLAPARI
jgi:hypothetical protein